MAGKSRAASGLSPRGEMQIRQRICAEAARIMSAEGVRDFHTAKRKAALRLNIPNAKHLPSNEEVEAALRDYLQLFHAQSLSTTLRHLRNIALEAMRFFQAFDPRLVGPVLSGTVTAQSAIQLHVCADTPEEIGLLLAEHHIPYDETDKRLRYGGERQHSCPTYLFTVDSATIELYVLNRESIREAPLSPVDGKPMKRASIKELTALVQRTGSEPASGG
jgi:hypothetical protein